MNNIEERLRSGTSERQRFELAASVAAHEMARPLSTAMAAVELLRSRLPEADDVALDLVGTAARQLRIARLQTSRLAQLAVGVGAPEKRPVDLAALAHEVVDDLALSELAHHPSTVEAVPDAHAAVDADQIRQVLYNLLTNAANYSPRGREIVVDVSQEAEHVRVRVRDQGHGVAPDAAERIFEPYQRGHDEAPGIGLGLALSRDIARGHGGDLTLEPAPKGGAVFVLSLPRRPAPSV